MNSTLSPQQSGDFRAFLNEVGISFEPPTRVNIALVRLSAGESPIDVMRRYQVVVVSNGSPDKSEIEAFCYQFTKGLGYCPETLAYFAELPPYALLPEMPTGAFWGRVLKNRSPPPSSPFQVSTPPVKARGSAKSQRQPRLLSFAAPEWHQLYSKKCYH